MAYVRTHEFFGLTDLTRSYWSVVLDDKTASLQRLWLKVSEETGKIAFGDPKATWVEFVTKTLNFGQKAASVGLKLTMWKGAEELLPPASEVQRAVQEMMYVDDLPNCHSDEQKGIEMREKT